MPASGIGVLPRDDPPYRYVADYLAGRPPQDRLECCESAVLADPGLQYVAHYSDQTCNFALDKLDRPYLAATLDSRPEQVRRAILEVGDELVYRLQDFDQRLAPLQTGAVIRTVYQTLRGALFCYAVVPGEYVVAFCADSTAGGVALTQQAAVRQTDQAVAALVTELRCQLSRGGQNPGGWKPGDPTHERVPSPVQSATEIGPTAIACRDALSVAQLHYVAWIKNREIVYAADALDIPQLSRFFPNRDITPARRREMYERLAWLLGLVSPELSGLIEPVVGEPLQRMVLDVEGGAIYWYRRAAGEFLMGVTLDQSQVQHADDDIANLTILVQK